MKTLVLARHSKSSWKFPELDDHDRPLNKRGLNNAPMMAERLVAALQHLGVTNEVVLTSSAVRAKAFAQQISLACQAPLIESEDLYTFSASHLLKALEQHLYQFDHATVVAHNPAMTELSNRLSQLEIDNLPTSGITILKCDISSWRDLTNHRHDCVYFDYPKKML